MASNINRSSVFVHGPSAFLWCWTMKNCHHEPFFLMVQVSYQLMMSDLNPLQSMCLPPPPPTACLFICLFLKKRNGTGMHRGAIQSGTPAIRECSYPGESYIIIINPSVCYIYAPSEYIDEKRRGEKPQAGPTGRPPARALSYWHSLPSFIIDTGGRSAIDCGTRHPCHPRHIQPRKFLFRSPSMAVGVGIYSRP